MYQIDMMWRDALVLECINYIMFHVAAVVWAIKAGFYTNDAAYMMADHT